MVTLLLPLLLLESSRAVWRRNSGDKREEDGGNRGDGGDKRGERGVGDLGHASESTLDTVCSVICEVSGMREREFVGDVNLCSDSRRRAGCVGGRARHDSLDGAEMGIGDSNGEERGDMEGTLVRTGEGGAEPGSRGEE